jgi:hypothetical protein
MSIIKINKYDEFIDVVNTSTIVFAKTFFSGSKIGIHGGDCKGIVSVQMLSPTHYALHCANCGRMPSPEAIPIEIDSIEKLNSWCTRQIESATRYAQDIHQLWSEHQIIGVDCKANEDLELGVCDCGHGDEDPEIDWEALQKDREEKPADDVFQGDKALGIPPRFQSSPDKIGENDKFC